MTRFGLIVVSAAVLFGSACEIEKTIEVKLDWSESASHDGDPEACPDNNKPGEGAYEVDRLPSGLDKEFTIEAINIKSFTATSTTTGDAAAVVGYNDWSLGYRLYDPEDQAYYDETLATSAEVQCATPVLISDIASANACLEKIRVHLNTDTAALEGMIVTIDTGPEPPTILAGGEGFCSSTSQFNTTWDAVMLLDVTVKTSNW